MSTIIIIPARMQSKRLPGKPLKKINGIPLIQRVYDQCKRTGIPNVYVTSDSDEILDLVPYHARIKVDSKKCNCGTDRVAMAALRLGLDLYDIVLNIQGDMPFIDPQLIRGFAEFMENRQCKIGTVAIPSNIKDKADYVSCVLDCHGSAVYFSRQLLKCSENQFLRHVGMYGFTLAGLVSFIGATSTLEHVEKLEQLRIIENRIGTIEVMLTDLNPGPEVNIEDDLISAQHWGKSYP